MQSNPLLTMKDRVQQRLDIVVEHDLRAYIANLHRIAVETEKTYHVTFRYISPEGQPVVKESPSRIA